MKRMFLYAGGCLVIVFCVVYWLFFAAISSADETVFVKIDADDNVDSVYAKVKNISHAVPYAGFKLTAKAMGYDNHVRTGRYEVNTNIGAFRLLRHLKNRQQAPVRLTIPTVRTVERLASELSKQLMPDSTAWANALQSEAFCKALGYDTSTIMCVFIPNTYEVYWDVTPEKFLQKMKKESDAFWTSSRRQKAADARLTPNEVIVVASIVEQETANNAEKPMIAGMYLNRYHKGMKLQADPTVKFATKQFQLRRISGSILFTDSPYNTYKYAGLPPGPICIPSMASIESVLNYVQHDYLYMCAKEDFSGTHNFARTYAEHQKNAQKYTDALNKRGIME